MIGVEKQIQKKMFLPGEQKFHALGDMRMENYCVMIALKNMKKCLTLLWQRKMKSGKQYDTRRTN